MVSLFVRHTVSDYAAWRKLFDEFQTHGAAMGIRSAAVYQSVDDPNDVTVTHDFDSAETARSFTQSDDLKKAMQQAGVIGAPTVWITSKT